MAKTGDTKTRRKALRIVAFLGVLVALTCLGTVTVFQATLGELRTGLITLDANVAERFPDGTVWALAEEASAMEQRAPTDSVHLILTVGLPEDTVVDDPATLRADVWTAYCDAFAEGGIHLGSVAVGRAVKGVPHGDFRSFGAVSGWEDGREDAASLVERTGRAAPDDLAIVAWFGNSLEIRENGE